MSRGPGAMPVAVPAPPLPLPAHAAARRRRRPRPSAPALELLRVVDAGVAAAAVLTAFVIAQAPAFPGGAAELLAQQLTLRDLLWLGGCVAVWQQLFVLAGLYGRGAGASRGNAAAVVGACAAGTLLVLLFPPLGASGLLTVTQAAALWGATAAATLGARAAISRLAAAPRARRHVIIVGTGPRALRLHAELCAAPAAEYHLLGFVDSVLVDEARPAGERAPADPARERYLGTLDDLEALLMRTVVDAVLVALPVKSHYADIQRAIDTCARAGVECQYPVDIFHSPLVSPPRIDAAERAPFMRVPVACDDWRLLVKRAIDVAGASAALLLLSPLLVLIALAVRLTSPGPAFFVQERYGFRKRRFPMLKFRTMVSDAVAQQSLLEDANEASGPVFKIRNDPRVTRVGAFLRRTSLDELPQLVNVLRGDMSLVGPRPLPVRDVERFDAAWFMRRFSVLPGLTCLWQISGRSDLTFDDWIALDLDYIDRWSLRMDVGILLRTVPAVVRGTGAR